MDDLTTLDEILTIEPGTGAIGVRTIPPTLAIFETHFPRFPVLPGVLLLDGLARLGVALLEAPDGRTWRLSSVEGIRFRHFARPGDRLELRVEVGVASHDAVTMKGSVHADGRPITTARRLTFVPRDS